MRKGYDPQLILDEHGDIVALATGSDACAEHETGSAAMQQALCSAAAVDGNEMERRLVQGLRKGQDVCFADVLQRKRLDRNLDQLHFVKGVDRERGEAAAVMSFSARGAALVGLGDFELRIFERTQAIAGAWDEAGFAFKVIGERLVAALERFVQAARQGDVVFAGTFLADQPDKRLSGVVLARVSKLRAQDLEQADKAQRQWKDSLRLKAASRLDELQELVRHARAGSNVRLPGYLWPVWSGAPGSQVLYALNPNHDVKASYWGPYDFEQLERWVRADSKFELVPVSRRPAEKVA